MKSPIRGAALAAWAMLAGCGSDSGTRPDAHSMTIGPEGGSFVIGVGEVSLAVPPGALRAAVSFSIAEGDDIPLRGWLGVGVPFRIVPERTEFALPAQLVLPFDPTLVGGSVDPSEIRVAHRDADGLVAALVPTFVDSRSVMIEVDTLGDFRVTAPDVVDAPSLFPLVDADEYEFEGALTLRIARSVTEPNLAPLDVARATFDLGERSFGMWFDDRGGQLAIAGRFDAPSWQELYAEPVLLIDRRDPIGTVRPVSRSYAGYVPLGSTTVGYDGIAETTTVIGERRRLRTGAGVFGVVHVTITTRFVESQPNAGETRLELWLANGVGPVALRLGATEPMRLLRRATVGGRQFGE